MHSFYLENVTTPVLYKMLEELRAGGNTVKAHPVYRAVCRFGAWKARGFSHGFTTTIQPAAGRRSPSRTSLSLFRTH